MHLKSDLKARALVDTGIEARRKNNGTLGHTFEDVQDEALLDTLAYKLLEEEAVLLGNTLGDVYIEEHVDTLADILADVQVATLGQTIALRWLSE